MTNLVNAFKSFILKISSSKNSFKNMESDFKEVSGDFQKLDSFFKTEIKETNRTPGVYAIKPGIHGNRIEYRSLPNQNRIVDKILNCLSSPIMKGLIFLQVQV